MNAGLLTDGLSWLDQPLLEGSLSPLSGRKCRSQGQDGAMPGQFRAHGWEDPVIITKTWINPSQAQVIIEPLSSFGGVNEGFGEEVTITKVNNMPVRDATKSRRSPINPQELRDRRSPIAPAKHERGEDSGLHSCANHNGTSPRQQKRALDILNIPGAVGSSRSLSPAERSISRRRTKSGDGPPCTLESDKRRHKSGQSTKSDKSDKKVKKAQKGHHILDDCDSEKWAGKSKSRNSRQDASPSRPKPSPRQSRSRRESERYPHYDVDRRSPMPPRRSPNPDSKPRSKGRSREESEGSRERVPSARSRRLYRNEYYYSDGFTESASSDDWPTPTRKKAPEKKQKKEKEEKEVIDVKNSKLSKENKEKVKTALKGLTAFSDPNKGARKPEQTVEPDDPWGGNSPRHRIEQMEASFGPDQEGPIDPELELEDEILQEVEEAELRMASTPSETEVDEVGAVEQKVSSPEPYICPVQILTPDFEMPVYVEKPTEETIQATMMANNVVTSLNTGAVSETDKDSCLGLSIDRSSAPSTEPPRTTIEAAFTMAAQDGEEARYVFEPQPLLQMVGKIRDTETGETFEVYTDGPLPQPGNLEDGISMSSNKSELEEEDDVGWCSVYFAIRAVGLCCVVGFLLGLIMLSLYA